MASLTTNSCSIAVDLIYPVGSIYISVNPTNPQVLFGGNWIQIDQGRFLIASGDNYPVKSTGGEATHTLSIDELPAHDHSGTFNGSGTTSSAGAHTHTRGTMNITGVANSPAETYYGSPSGAFYLNGTGASVGGHEFNVQKLGFDASRSWSGSTSSAGAHTHTFSVTGSTNSQGGNKPHNNIPPYFAVYMWYRES